MFMINRWILVITLVTSLIYPLSSQELTTATSTIFSGSGNCASCHAPGSPNTAALVDSKGRDVSPVTLWRSTMMANAARDPLWRAKVSVETKLTPSLKAFIEDKCTTCHAPMGRTQAIADGADYYSIAEMEQSPLALDGVSCTVCHQIKDVNLGTPESFSGHYVIENDRLIYGPYANPVTGPMQNSVNYTPVHSVHIKSSELCATCHTLFTPTVDENGNVVGEIAEQTPYLEWKNSTYPQQNIECQTCHVPEINEGIVISNRPVSLSARTPFGLHYFVGGNVFMLKMLKAHGNELGVTATATQFDSTIARTLRLLQNETVRLNATADFPTDDTLRVRVAVQNLSGHKFPTGYPSRRAWLHVVVTDANGTVIFESGAWDPESGEIRNLDAGYEPHYDRITDSAQVQIYEAIMGNTSGAVTYTLLRGATYLKDNRLPPLGFTTTHISYDSTRIYGRAAEDPNFNRNGDQEGTGIDTVTYIIGNVSANTDYQITVEMVYQTAMPRFIADLLQHDTPEVTRFAGYYQSADKSPIPVASITVGAGPTGIDHPDPAVVAETPLLVQAYPNPFNPQVNLRIQARETGWLTVTIYTVQGQKLHTLYSGIAPAGTTTLQWDGKTTTHTVASGMYYVVATLKTPHQQYQSVKRILLVK